MAEAEFVFHEELNDFLPADRRGQPLRRQLREDSTAKDTIEAIGIPHPEIGRVVVNGVEVGFGHRLGGGDRVEVFPSTASPIDLAPRFILDGHLGRLARYLRMLGLDVVYEPHADDSNLAHRSADEDRLLLTRDLGLLKRSVVRRGAFVRSEHPAEQLAEIVRRFGLAPLGAPFGRCVRCNTLLTEVARDDVYELLPPRTRAEFDEFRRCPTCGSAYWKGSHYDRMSRLLGQILEAAAESADATARAPDRLE